MASKARKETFLRYLFPFQFTHNRGTVVSFLSDIFVNFQKRSNNNFDTYTFQELIGIPMIVSDKLYYTFTMHQEKQLSYQEFSSGLYDLLFGDFDDKMSIVFDLLDFDGDGVITSEDVFLILSHFHLIDNTSDTIHLIEKLIINFFGVNKYKLDKENCFNIKKNFDVLLLVLLFLNKYLTVISDLELIQYEQITRRKKNDKGGFSGYNLYTMDDYEEMEYKPTITLFNYLELTEFGKKKKRAYDYEDSDSEEDLDSDDEDLDALYEFSIDFQELRDRFINQCSYEPRLLTSTFSCSFFQEERAKMKEQKKEDSVKLLDEILMNQSYKRMKFKEKRKFDGKEKDKINNKNLQNKEKEKIEKSDDNMSSAGNHLGDSTNVDSTSNFTSLRRAVTNFNGIKRTTTKMKNKIELVLFKKKEGKKANKQVKFLLCGHYIFYYINNRGNFLYKKIIPISSLFIVKSKKDNNIYLSLLSFLHNLEMKKDFFTDKIEEANKFFSKFNRNKMFRDMKKEYYFKAKVGEGKFGQVILAERLCDRKMLAIKAVQKGTQSIEEYKINRWETDIFRMLQNINHPNIIKCIDLYEYECQIFFVYEFIASGDLRKISKELKLFPQYYTINIILKLSMQMIEGIKILHKYGVIHRDIKTTNMMIDIKSSSDQNNNFLNSGFETDLSNIGSGVVKIIDFGLSRILGKYEYSNDPYGSLCFKAPELIEHLPYDFKVDIWAIGVTIYYLVYKELPYEKGTKEEIKYNIVHENVPFHRNSFINNFNYYDGTIKLDNINSHELKSSILFSLLRDCLEKNPDMRLSIEQLSEKYTHLIKTIS